ncbi:MAG: hypothetical protein ACLU9S_23905 [Oscillospiraceae bacterium]
MDGLQEPLPQNRVTDLAHLARRLSTAGHEPEGVGGTVDPPDAPGDGAFTHTRESTPVIFGPGRGAEDQPPQLESKEVLAPAGRLPARMGGTPDVPGGAATGGIVGDSGAAHCAGAVDQ